LVVVEPLDVDPPELDMLTLQEALFSQPQPSPSGSLDAEAQVGVVEPLVLTWQDWLFSQPQPSPSGSLAAEVQVGYARAEGDVMALSNTRAANSFNLFIIYSLVMCRVARAFLLRRLHTDTA
jgi:hypothetical protein